MTTLKELREAAQMSLKDFSSYLNIPYRTMQNWEGNQRKAPEYLVELISYKLKKEGLIKEEL